MISLPSSFTSYSHDGKASIHFAFLRSDISRTYFPYYAEDPALWTGTFFIISLFASLFVTSTRPHPPCEYRLFQAQHRLSLINSLTRPHPKLTRCPSNPVYAGKFDLVAYGDTTGTTHTGSIYHDRVQADNRRNLQFFVTNFITQIIGPIATQTSYLRPCFSTTSSMTPVTIPLSPKLPSSVVM